MSVLPSVTVSILTYNGETYLDRILTAVEEQDYAGQVDLLIVDSGSTDGTLSIAAAHPGARLVQIPNSEFGHGRTRNLVASLADGEIVVYLTHDAVPIGSGWLGALVEPFRDDDRTAAVMGKQVPRAGCLPIIKYDIKRTFRWMGPDTGITVFYDHGQLGTPQSLEAAGFYSDVNSAARRSVVTGSVPYRDVSYAEDHLFGRDLLSNGLRKTYAPLAAVEHSNDLTVRSLGTRIREEINGLREIGTTIPEVSVGWAIAQTIRGSIIDSVEIVVDRELSGLARVGWLFANPVAHWVKWNNYRKAARGAIATSPEEHPSS